MDYQVKKWSHTLQCWVLDTGKTREVKEREKHEPGTYWDAKEGRWVKDVTQEKSLTAQIADVGKEVEKRKIEEIPATKVITSSSSSSSSYQYNTTRPWTGMDRFKWPNTFMTLIKMYYAKDWWSAGPYIAEDDYRDRILKGIYKPQVKYPSYTSNYGNYGNYGPGYSWEEES